MFQQHPVAIATQHCKKIKNKDSFCLITHQERSSLGTGRFKGRPLPGALMFEKTVHKCPFGCPLWQIKHD